MRPWKEECAAGTRADIRQPCRPGPWLPDSAKGYYHSPPSGRESERVLAAVDGDDDGAIHGDDVNRAFRAVFVGVVARWSSRCRVVVGEVPGRRRHGGAGLRTCEDAA